MDKRGEVHEDDRVWRTGFSKWKKVGEVDRFKPHLEKQEPNHRKKKTKRK